MNDKTLLKTVAVVILLCSSAARSQHRIDWQATDACGSGGGANAARVLYTSSGQSAVGVSHGSSVVLQSGYLFVRAVPTGTPTIVSQSSVDFGSVIVGQSETRQLTVSNGGGLPLDITGTSVSPPVFVIVSGGGAQRINPGDFVVMTLRFMPATAGLVAGSLVITSNASNAPTHTVSLSGTGVISAPAISLSAVTLDFGSVAIGSSAVRSVTVSNTGNAPLDVTGQSLGGAHASDYTITHACGTPIAPAGSDYIEILFTPSATGMRTAALLVSSNDPNTPAATVSLSGTGASTAQPHITVSQNTIDFGTTNPGTPVDRDVVISNTGTAALVLAGQSVTGTSFLLLTPAGGTIAPGGNSTARIRFDPASTGSFTGTFSVSSNDPVSPTVVVSLRGVGGGSTGPRLVLGTTVLDFGAVPILQAKELDLEIRNTGTSDLVITSQLIAGTDALHFSISQAAASPVVPGGRTTLRVRHLPTTAGSKVALLRLLTNDPGMPIAEVALISTAVGAEAPPSPAADARLVEAYPNPFADHMTIAYELGSPGDVQLAVYDLHGRIVSLQQMENRSAGVHGAVFDASGLPSGIYIAVLKVLLYDGRCVTRLTTMHCLR